MMKLKIVIQKIKLAVMLVLICASVSCTKKKLESLSSLSEWINNPTNGLIESRSINGIKIDVKYLPPDYLYYKDFQQDHTDSTETEKKLSEYQKTLTFMITIGPDEKRGNSNDIMFDQVKNYKEYADRLLTMNFDLEKNIRLKVGELEIKPVLSALENSYGLTKSRNIILVFAPSSDEKQIIEKSNIDFIYEDELFGMGTMHFSFSSKNLKEVSYISHLKK